MTSCTVENFRNLIVILCNLTLLETYNVERMFHPSRLSCIQKYPQSFQICIVIDHGARKTWRGSRTQNQVQPNWGIFMQSVFKKSFRTPTNGRTDQRKFKIGPLVPRARK